MGKSYQELCAEIEALKAKAESVRTKEIAKTVAEVRRLIEAYGLTAADCGFVRGKAASGAKKGKGVAPKYRHPDDASLTWTGRGKSPKWLSELESAGRKREEFLI